MANHHHIPEFFIEKWANSDGKVLRYRRKPDNGLSAKWLSPGAIGYGVDLYSISDNSDKEIIETKFFQKIDSKGAEALEVLLSDGDIDNPDLRKAWAEFVVASRVRTPSQLAAYEEMGHEETKKEVLKVDYSLHPGKSVEQELKILADNPHLVKDMSRKILPEVIQVKNLSKKLYEMQWGVVYFLDATVDLVLGDEPLYNKNIIGNQDCLLALPLRPDALFIASYYDGTLDKIQSHNPNQVVKEMNRHSVSQASTFVFTTSNCHEKLIEKRLRLYHGKKELKIGAESFNT